MSKAPPRSKNLENVEKIVTIKEIMTAYNICYSTAQKYRAITLRAFGKQKFEPITLEQFRQANNI